MKIDVTNWQPFLLSDLFKVEGITPTDKQTLSGWGHGDYPHITSSTQNNGVAGFYDHYTQEGNVLTMESTAKGRCFYQAFPFSAGGHVEKLSPLFPFDYQIAMFFCTIINQTQQFYSYGRKCNKEQIKDMKLYLPILKDDSGEPIIEHIYHEDGYLPDIIFMKKFIQSLNIKLPITENEIVEEPDKEGWQAFRLSDLFEITKGKRLPKDEQTKGNTLYVSASSSNNGVNNYIGQKPLFNGNTITLSYNGSVGEAFYQPLPYWASDDVCSLSSKYKGFNVFHALFICTVLKQEKAKYSYGLKWTLEKMRETSISLPEKDGKPDYDYMQKYMMSCPFADNLVNPIAPPK